MNDSIILVVKERLGRGLLALAASAQEQKE